MSFYPAFTLAEVLITLGIIGVIAALTIPGLISKWREKATVAQVKETYSILQQGFRRAIDEYGDVSSWCDISEGYKKCTDTIFNNLSATTRISPCGVNKCFSSGQSYKNRFGKSNI